MRALYCVGNGHWKLHPESAGGKPAAARDCGVKVGTLVFLFDLFL